jgi:uncharacterized membrane protein
MQKERLAAFTDGVIAIIITIMVLELKVPHGAEVSALAPLVPVFLSYVMSFVYVAIYWNNHHHLLHAVEKVDGTVLWANMHLLFWLSLIPFATAWAGENHFAPAPTALYGAALLMPAIAWYVLQLAIIRVQGAGGRLARVLGRDLKGKLPPLAYLIAIGAAFVEPWVSLGIYIAVAAIWLIPDRRIESALAE